MTTDAPTVRPRLASRALGAAAVVLWTGGFLRLAAEIGTRAWTAAAASDDTGGVALLLAAVLVGLTLGGTAFAMLRWQPLRNLLMQFRRDSWVSNGHSGEPPPLRWPPVKVTTALALLLVASLLVAVALPNIVYAAGAFVAAVVLRVVFALTAPPT